MENMIEFIETNPWFLGAMVVLSNIGVSFLKDDLDDRQGSALNCQLFRKLVVFGLVFCSTHSLKISTIMTFLYTVIVTCL